MTEKSPAGHDARSAGHTVLLCVLRKEMDPDGSNSDQSLLFVGVSNTSIICSQRPAITCFRTCVAALSVAFAAVTNALGVLGAVPSSGRALWRFYGNWLPPHGN